MSSYYSNTPEPALRLGDVVSGFPAATPQVHRFVDSDDAPRDFVIKVNQPKFLVVMTPCCSIEDGAVILAPLTMVRPDFFRSPHFEEDLTRINRLVAPRDSVPPEAWKRLTPEEQVTRLNENPGFVFIECFVYAPHPLLRSYSLKKGNWTKETGHYMLDFKTLYRFECSHIQRDAPAPAGCSKLLQLTAAARQELREKLTYFFSRPAQEDLAELAAQAS